MSNKHSKWKEDTVFAFGPNGSYLYKSPFQFKTYAPCIIIVVLNSNLISNNLPERLKWFIATSDVASIRHVALGSREGSYFICCINRKGQALCCMSCNIDVHMRGCT